MIRRNGAPRRWAWSPGEGSRGEMWPQRKQTFIWGPVRSPTFQRWEGEWCTSCFAKVVCSGGHLRRQEGGAILKVSREGMGHPHSAHTWGRLSVGPVFTCVYLLGLCSSPRRPQMPADMSPSSLEEQSFKPGEMGVPKSPG